MPEQAEEVKTPNAVRCTICGSTADLLNCGLYQCRATSAHMADAEEQPPTHWMPKPDPPGTEIQSPKGTNAERMAAALFSCWGGLLDRLGPE